MAEEDTKVASPEAAAPVAAAPESESVAQNGSTETKQAAAEEVTSSADAKEQPSSKPTQTDPKDHAKNVKSDPKLLPVTDDPVAIRGQVEYYFGDSNLPRDKFLWDSTGGEENKPVALKTLCTFQRMRRFQPYTAVVAALRESSRLVVEGEEGEETIKRKYPYKPSSERKKQAEASTIYAKGFGDEVATTQFDIEAFFAQYGPVNYIKLRRTPEKVFKGSVFVEFQDEELAKKFIELAPKWKEQDLKILSKKDYCEEKNQLIREGKMEPNSTAKPFYEGRDGSARGRGRGGRQNGRGGHEATDPNDWKKRRDDDQKNGFRDRRGGRGGRGSRGGRGRGRGFRGRGGRGGRDRNDGEGREEKKAPQEPSAHDVNGVKPRINVGDAPKAASEANGKRARDDDGATGQPPAKKVDAKGEAAPAA